VKLFIALAIWLAAQLFNFAIMVVLLTAGSLGWYSLHKLSRQVFRKKRFRIYRVESGEPMAETFDLAEARRWCGDRIDYSYEEVGR
jgi:hypothetical protein